MFCIGAAPTSPGIIARFSMPQSPRSRVQRTSSCQSSPAAAVTSTRSRSMISLSTPRSRLTMTRPGKLSTKSVLLPPPRSSTGNCVSSRSGRSWVSSRRASSIARAGSRKVLKASSGAFLWTSLGIVVLLVVLRGDGPRAVAHQVRPVVDEPGIEFHYIGSGGDLGDRVSATHDAAAAHDRKRFAENLAAAGQYLVRRGQQRRTAQAACLVDVRLAGNRVASDCRVGCVQAVDAGGSNCFKRIAERGVLPVGRDLDDDGAFSAKSLGVTFAGLHDCFEQFAEMPAVLELAQVLGIGRRNIHSDIVAVR